MWAASLDNSCFAAQACDDRNPWGNACAGCNKYLQTLRKLQLIPAAMLYIGAVRQCMAPKLRLSSKGIDYMLTIPDAGAAAGRPTSTCTADCKPSPLVHLQATRSCNSICPCSTCSCPLRASMWPPSQTISMPR